MNNPNWKKKIIIYDLVFSFGILAASWISPRPLKLIFIFTSGDIGGTANTLKAPKTNFHLDPSPRVLAAPPITPKVSITNFQFYSLGIGGTIILPRPPKLIFIFCPWFLYVFPFLYPRVITSAANAPGALIRLFRYL